MITPHEAWERIAQNTTPLPAEEVPLEAALRRYLAETLCADRDHPPADRSAMDGYAVRAEDLSNLPARLRVVGEIPAGAPADHRFGVGECVRIFTGANVPVDADTVVPVELTSVGSFRDGPDDGAIEVVEPARQGANILRRGENTKEGETLLAPGTLMNGHRIGLCAAFDKATLRVGRLPRTGVFSTGEELLAPGVTAEAHHTRDSNGPMLIADLQAEGFADTMRGVLSDNLDTTTSALRQAAESCHLIIVTGGVSVGIYDYVPAALDQAGGKTIFHGVSMKPGKPQLFGTLGESLVFGLPGNPLSVITGLYEFALPILRVFAGCPIDACRPMRQLIADAPFRGDPIRQRYAPSRIILSPEGDRAQPLPSKGSADLVRGSQADGAVLVPPGKQGIKPGEAVEFRPWKSTL